MKISAATAINLKANLDSFATKQVPFALVITKNIKKLDEIVSKFEEKRQDIINQYAIVDESGKFIAITKEDGTKVENPQTLMEIEVSDREKMMLELSKIEQEEYDIEFAQIDAEKMYYDSKAGEKMKISDFIDANLEPALIMYLNSFEIIKL